MNQFQRYTIYLFGRISQAESNRDGNTKPFSALIFIILFLLLLTGFIPVYSQTKEVVLVGRVTDAKTFEPLAGVVVHIKGTTHQVLTNETGDFKFITGQRVPLVYELSFVGFKSREVEVSSYDYQQILLENNNKSDFFHIRKHG